jgi:hypothetical protein
MDNFVQPGGGATVRLVCQAALARFDHRQDNMRTAIIIAAGIALLGVAGYLR